MEAQNINSSSLSCELRIIKAKNICTKSDVAIFVRCYLCAGNNTRVKLDTQEITIIPSKSDTITFDQTFSLDCLGNQDSIKWLKQGTLIFELRSRSNALIGRIKGSKLIGRAEVPWGNFVDLKEIEIKKWVMMVPQNGHVYDDVIKPAAVEIAVKVQEFDKGNMGRKKISDHGRGDEWCGCMDGGCNSCVAYEFFAIEAALEAL